MSPARWQSFNRLQSASIVVCVVLVASLLPTQTALASHGGGTEEHWVGTWATAVVARPPETPQRRQAPPTDFSNQTPGQIVRLSLGGERVRVVLSNTFGTAPLAIGGAQVARRARNAAILPSSSRVLTFGGIQPPAFPPAR